MFNETEFAAFALPFFVKALGLTEDVIKEKSMTTEGQAELQRAYGESKKSAKSEGYKEATGKYQKQLEKLAKDTFGVEIPKDDDNPTDVASVISAIKDGYKPEPDKPGEISDNAVKKHPLFLRMEQDKTDAEKKLKDRNDEFDTKLNEQVAKRTKQLNIQQMGESALPELGAKLPAHEGQRKLLVQQYKDSYNNIEQREENGKTYFYEVSTGARIEDDMGTPLDWDALKRRQAEQFFELEGANRDSPGAKNESGNSGGGGKSVNLNPKTLTDLNKVLENTTLTAEQRSAATTFYRANGTDL